MGWGLSPRHQNKVYNCAANDSTKLCKCVGYIRLKRIPDRGWGCQWIGLSVSAQFYNCAANNSETRAPIESWWCDTQIVYKCSAMRLTLNWTDVKQTDSKNTCVYSSYMIASKVKMNSELVFGRLSTNRNEAVGGVIMTELTDRIITACQSKMGGVI